MSHARAGSRYPGRKLLTTFEDSNDVMVPLRATPREQKVMLRGSVKSRARYASKKIPRKMIRSCMYAQAQLRWTAVTQSFGSTTGVFQLLNGLTQGTAVNNRVGNQVRFLELEYTGIASFNASPSIGTDQIRVVVLKDTQPNGAAPTTTELLCLTSQNSCFNPDFVGNQARPRFNILANHLLCLNNPGPINTSSDVVVSHIVAGKLKLDFTTTYTADAGTVADIQTNSLYCFCITGTSQSTLALTTCLKWIDV